MIYYVYIYLRTNDLTPYYVGKGKGRRAWDKINHTVVVPTDKNRIKLVAHKLSEAEAFILEKKLIEIYGRKDIGSGILRNTTNGGQGASGAIRNVETYRIALTKWHSEMSDEEKEKRAESCGKGQQERYKNSTDSEKTKNRKSTAHQGTYRIESPDGQVWITTTGLKEFAKENSDIITFGSLFWAYRKCYNKISTTRKRRDLNNWKVERID